MYFITIFVQLYKKKTLSYIMCPMTSSFQLGINKGTFIKVPPESQIYIIMYVTIIKVCNYNFEL